MKAIRISNDLHARFKAACALRSVPMSEVVERALERLLERWKQEQMHASISSKEGSA